LLLGGQIGRASRGTQSRDAREEIRNDPNDLIDGSVYGFSGEAVHGMTKFTPVGFTLALDRELGEERNQGGSNLSRWSQD
jgi:hypothetical protein